MNGPVLARIPADYYSEYRYEAIFRAYKWDPQVEDHNTVADHAVLLDRATARQLEEWAEKLTDETMRMEESIKGRPELIKKLGFPRAVEKAIGRMDHYDPAKHIRLMRFDFHPTTEGWAVSEVNSDVPGGLAEASVLPAIAQRCFPGYIPHENTARHLLEAFQ